MNLFDKLPDELVVKIFTYLNSEHQNNNQANRDYRNLRKTCKRFCRIVNYSVEEENEPALSLSPVYDGYDSSWMECDSTRWCGCDDGKCVSQDILMISDFKYIKYRRIEIDDFDLIDHCIVRAVQSRSAGLHTIVTLELRCKIDVTVLISLLAALPNLKILDLAPIDNSKDKLPIPPDLTSRTLSKLIFYLDYHKFTEDKPMLDYILDYLPALEVQFHKRDYDFDEDIIKWCRCYLLRHKLTIREFSIFILDTNPERIKKFFEDLDCTAQIYVDAVEICNN